MEVKFIPLEKAKQLEEIIGFLSNYKGSDSEIHHVGASIKLEDKDEEFTKLLHRLAEINIEREEIINKFKNA